MLRLLRLLILTIGRGLLWFRYRIRLHGYDQVANLKGPLLILPSHPAYIDPPIMLTTLRHLSPRPLLFDGNFKGALAWVIPLLNALRIPDLGQASTEARQRTEEAIEGIKDALRKGDNVILWPSGHLERAGIEKLGSARTASDVLRAVPEAKIVLIRTRGLWGSRFSYGWDGKTPSFGKVLLQGIGWVLANGLFFMPRRQVDVHIEHVERSRLPGLERDKLNPWLDNYYHPDGPEKPTFVPLHFAFGPRTHEFPTIETGPELDLGKVRAEVREAVNELVQAKLPSPVDPAKLTPDVQLDSLGIDSLERQDLSLRVERQFGFRGDVVPSTLGQLYALAAGILDRQPPKPPPESWFKPLSGEKAEILGETIPEAFVHRALASRGDLISVDDLAGALTFEKLLVGALSLANSLRALPEKHVGLLLPASVGCDVALMALYLADKVPVVFNWTTGQKNLDHAANLAGVKHIVSSKAFIDRMGLTIAGTTFLYLEELRTKTGRFALAWTLAKVRYFPALVRNAVPKVDPDSPAVILFTSGSEKAPKAVPLTHRNLLSNQKSGLQVLQVNRTDSLLGFLPAFHSFGMSVTGLLPLLTGVRVVRHPDPTAAAALARKAGSYRVSVLVGTPTFVNYILERSAPGELASLRMVIVGAEKCPQAVFDRMAKEAPSARILEGYGITECSPVVSVNPPDGVKHGTIGKALPGVELRVVDLDTDKPLPTGSTGMLLVAGPTIFPGYLGADAPVPFKELDGKRWYVTGDLVSLDAEGYITFAGRLKRFIKIGGEMISLPALEAPFVERFPATKDGPRVAVEGVEIEGNGGRIVLFTTEAITVREANDLLLAAGFHGVMRLNEVRRIDSLPVLGTGKTDYKVLRAQILEGAK